MLFLASFTFEDRDAWYKDVTENGSGHLVKSIENLTKQFKILAQSLRPFCLLEPLSVMSELTASSPSDKENIEHIQPKVPQLSPKWLEVLKLSEGLKTTDYLTPENTSYENSFGISNLSQLFVNIYILDKSINWDISALKTANKCRICRRKANDQMILCDMCNRGYHIYCLKPPINSIDDIQGDWFCYTCVPRPTTTSSRKNSAPPKLSNAEADLLKKEQQDKPLSNNDLRGEINAADTISNNLNNDTCRICQDILFDKYSEVCCGRLVLFVQIFYFIFLGELQILQPRFSFELCQLEPCTSFLELYSLRTK